MVIWITLFIMKNCVFQQNEIEREDKLKKINEKIAASQAAKKPGKYTLAYYD